MKKKYLAIGLIALAIHGRAQKPDSLFQKKTVNKTDIQVLFSYYGQDGNNSAVTGGIGTEKLTVYATNLSIAHSFKRGNKITFSGGVDAITSASTDKIDFVVSSASYKDTRTHADLNYGKQFTKNDFAITGGTGFSIESDYFSIPVLLALNYKEPSGMRAYQFAFQAFFDDLRWGRLDPDYRKPEGLIYPAELRYKEWYDEYRRNSYNFKFGITQVVNKRLVAAIFPEFIYQKGLLATPFHRVYFNNDSLKVENLPGERFKFPIGLQVNYFLGGRTILKGQYDFYADNFGIIAHAIQMEAALKLTPTFTIAPFVRLYTQSGAKYFKPYRQHNIAEEYYTSDYDLSAFQSYKAGINLRFAPFRYMAARFLFDEVNLRYAFYHRSNGLDASIVSMVLDFTAEGKQKKENP